MAEASIDIRIYPNKEMTSVDMAELMDTAIFNKGVIQGCESKIENGVFTITSGRIVVGGRLGVVTGGTVPNPTTLTKTEKCYPLAVCDLQSESNPFYFLMATSADLARLGLDTEDRNTTFNVDGSINALIFGICDVDPATGLASNYEQWGQAKARKGWDWYNELYKKITDLDAYYADKLTWKLVQDRDISGKESNPIAIPSGAKEVFVSVFIQWTATQKISVDFYVPIVGHLFNPTSGAAATSHVNYWGKDNNGFVRLGTNRYNGNYYVKLLEAYNKDTNVLNSTYYRVYYR